MAAPEILRLDFLTKGNEVRLAAMSFDGFTNPMHVDVSPKARVQSRLAGLLVRFAASGERRFSEEIDRNGSGLPCLYEGLRPDKPSAWMRRLFEWPEFKDVYHRLHRELFRCELEKPARIGVVELSAAWQRLGVHVTVDYVDQPPTLSGSNLAEWLLSDGPEPEWYRPPTKTKFDWVKPLPPLPEPFVPRPRFGQRIQEFLASPESRGGVLLITGDMGTGKTTAMLAWLHERRVAAETTGDEQAQPVFVLIDSGRKSPATLIAQTIYEQLLAKHKLTGDLRSRFPMRSESGHVVTNDQGSTQTEWVPALEALIREKLGPKLRQARRREVIYVEAADQVADDHALHRLIPGGIDPSSLPAELSVVITARPGFVSVEKRLRAPQPFAALVDQCADGRALVEQRLPSLKVKLPATLLDRIFHPAHETLITPFTLDAQLRFLTSNEPTDARDLERWRSLQTKTALWLESPAERVRAAVDRVVRLCGWRRVEWDGEAVRIGENLVADVLGVLAVAIAPATCAILQESGLWNPCWPVVLDVAGADFFSDAQPGEAPLRFRHPGYGREILARWKHAAAQNRRLAGALTDRWSGHGDCAHFALRWLPTHLCEAGKSEHVALVDLLCDHNFIAARLKAKLLRELLADFQAAAEALEPERAAARRQQEKNLAAYTAGLIAFAEHFTRERGVSTAMLNVPSAAPSPSTQKISKAVNPHADFSLPVSPPLPSIALVTLLTPVEHEQAARDLRDMARPAARLAVTRTFLVQHAQRLTTFQNEAGDVPAGLVAAQWALDLPPIPMLPPPQENALWLRRRWAPGSELPLTMARPIVLIGHETFVRSLAVTPDGRRAVSADNAGRLRVWDLTPHGGSAIGDPLTGHKGSVAGVAVTPDGRRAVSAGHDGTVRVWNLTAQGGTAVGEPLAGHKGSVTSVAVTPDGRRVASGGHDGTLRIWDLTNQSGTAVGEPLAGHKDSVNSVAMTPDGRRAVSGGHDGTVRVWNLTAQGGTAVGEPLTGHKSSVASVAVTPDGRRVVSGGHDGTVRVWNLTEHGGTAAGECLAGHKNSVNSVAVTPDGRRAVSGGDDRTVRVWDLTEHGGTAAWEPFTGHSDWVDSVAVTADGLRAVSGGFDSTVRVWDLTAQSGIAAKKPLTGHDGWVHSVALTSDGRRAVSGGTDSTVRIWDLTAQGGTAVGEPLAGHKNSVYNVAVTPDGRRAVSGGTDSTVRIWDLTEHGGTAAGEPLVGHDGWVFSVALTPDGGRAVSGGHDGMVRVWDLTAQGGTAVGDPLAGHADWVDSVAVTADGRRAVSGGHDGMVRIWDLTAQGGTAVGDPLAGHDGGVHSVAVTADGRRAVSGGHDGTVRVWNLTEHGARVAGRLETVIVPLEPCCSVALAPEGKVVVVGLATGEVLIFDLINFPDLGTTKGDSP